MHGIGLKEVRNVAALKTIAMISTDGRGKEKDKVNALSAETISNIDAHM